MSTVCLVFPDEIASVCSSGSVDIKSTSSGETLNLSIVILNNIVCTLLQKAYYKSLFCSIVIIRICVFSYCTFIYLFSIEILPSPSQPCVICTFPLKTRRFLLLYDHCSALDHDIFSFTLIQSSICVDPITVRRLRIDVISWRISSSSKFWCAAVSSNASNLLTCKQTGCYA